MSEGTRGVKPPGELAQDKHRLKRRRYLNRLTLRQAADLAEINYAYLCQLEKGSRSAGPDVLWRLAGAYGCEVADLMPPERPKSRAA